jgi:hypothetical protein
MDDFLIMDILRREKKSQKALHLVDAINKKLSQPNSTSTGVRA